MDLGSDATPCGEMVICCIALTITVHSSIDTSCIGGGTSCGPATGCGAVTLSIGCAASLGGLATYTSPSYTLTSALLSSYTLTWYTVPRTPATAFEVFTTTEEPGVVSFFTLAQSFPPSRSTLTFLPS